MKINMQEIKTYKKRMLVKILAILLSCYAINTQAQFQFIYEKKGELPPTGIMGIAMGYGTIDEDGFPLGIRGDLRARLLHRVTAKFSFYRSNAMKSDYASLRSSNNMQFETCLLFRKLKVDGVSLGLYAGYDEGIRNTKFANVVLENTETGKIVGSSGTLDDFNKYSSDIKILFTTKLPSVRAGISFYNLTKVRYEQYYLCYTFLPKEPTRLYTTDVSNFNLTVPIRYKIDGLSHTKHGVILGYNTLIKNIVIMDVELGFRPSFYQTNPKEKLSKMQRSLFFQLSAGIRIF